MECQATLLCAHACGRVLVPCDASWTQVLQGPLLCKLLRAQGKVSTMASQLWSCRGQQGGGGVSPKAAGGVL